MAPKSNVPIRICGSKTRTGCKTCKQRHVKCDEGRPVCSRCQKAKRQCIYIDVPAEILQQESNTNPQPRFAVAPSSNHQPFSTFSIFDTFISPFGTRAGAEVAAVECFVAYLGKELAGSFSNEVWCNILPRVAQHEPAIWHAIVAVNTLDTSTRFGPGHKTPIPQINTAIKQYSKAIQELNMRLRTTEVTHSRDVVLLACILFTVFECLQGDLHSALRHISSGMKLLVEWANEARSSSGDDPGGYLKWTSIRPIFHTLDSQAVQMGAAGFRDEFAAQSIGDQPLVPPSFMTVEHAHLVLTHIFNRMSHWARWLDPGTCCNNKPDHNWMTLERQRLQCQLMGWDAAFDMFLKFFGQPPAALLLLVQRKIIEAFFHKTIDGVSEMEWDKYLPLFREAVEYAETYSASTQGTVESHPDDSNPSRPVFTLAMDLVMPLFLASTKCRDPVVRRRALALLKVCGRKEGIWDSNMCSRLAEKMIEIEEAGADENGFIPENARIYELDVRLGQQGKAGGEISSRKLITDESRGHYNEESQQALVW